jgi:glycerol-1-phosphatase
VRSDVGPELLASDVPLVAAHDRALLDLDGVVYRGRTAVPGADSTIAALRDGGCRVAFITNNASRTPQAVVDHLDGFGIRATAEEVVTSAVATARFVAEEFAGRTVLAVGGPGVHAALQEQGIEVVASADDRPGLVVVGFGPQVRVADLAEACYAIQRGAEFVATNLDASAPNDRGIGPAAGSMAGVVTGVTGVVPTAVGKPEPLMYREAAPDADPERVIVVGDRLDTDLRGATTLGMHTMHVLTGSHGVRDVLLADARERPTFLASDIRGLLDPHPAPKAADGGWSCGSATARVDDGVLALAGEPDLDLFRAACAAVWEARDAGQDVDLSAADQLDERLRPQR